ncbi:Uncharacterised protein [Candidatus Burarchaeum australiense]|nr:Uncharacterised protein [Candidatus Burarchaeum australiense]
MALEILSSAEKKECEKLVHEKAQIEGTLAAEGGPDLPFLLDACTSLSALMDELREISGKMGEIGYAALNTKVKFSRKVRHKGKEIVRFEQKLMRAYEQKRISLGHLQKMAEIIKLLKANKLDRAQEEAEGFRRLLETSRKFKLIADALSKKRAQVEKAKRSMTAQLSELEWLEKEPGPDLEKTGRHEERTHILESIPKIRSDYVQLLRSTPSGELLKKIRDEKLEDLGFPAITAEGLAALSAYLHKAGLESKTCGQLLELAELSPQKLKHLAIDLGEFRREVLERREFLIQVLSLQSGEFLGDRSGGSPALAHLSGQSEEARKAMARLTELDRTAEEDEREWKRVREIGRKKEGLAGVEKSSLVASLQALEALEMLLDEKALPEPGRTEGAPAQKKGDESAAGPVWKFLKSFMGK